MSGVVDITSVTKQLSLSARPVTLERSSFSSLGLIGIEPGEKAPPTTPSARGGSSGAPPSGCFKIAGSRHSSPPHREGCAKSGCSVGRLGWAFLGKAHTHPVHHHCLFNRTPLLWESETGAKDLHRLLRKASCRLLAGEPEGQWEAGFEKEPRRLWGPGFKCISSALRKEEGLQDHIPLT